MIDILEDLEEDYIWEKVRKGIDVEIYKGGYLFEKYLIVENFEIPDEAELHFLPYNNETKKFALNNPDDLYKYSDHIEDILEGFRVEIDDEKYLSIYKDEDTYLIMDHCENDIRVYEDDGYLIDLWRNDMEDLLLDSPIIKDSEEIDFFMVGFLYALLCDIFDNNEE